MTEPVGLAQGLTNYGDPDFALYLRRSFARSMGYSSELLARPVIGIADTRSGFNNCHRHFPELIEAVKRGVLAAGGLPLVFPTISLGEVLLNPTSLMFRNLMAIDTEEMIRAQPMDAVVLVGGCDKTVPAQLMGAVSANRPAIQLVAGPMLTSRWQGERLGPRPHCDAEIGRERLAGADDDRRLDQRRHSPDRDCRSRRRRHRSEPAQRDQRHDAGHRRSDADRSALHGGSVRRRRHRRG